MQQPSHPQAGKYFRINIEDGRSPAGFDQMLHGSLFKFLDRAESLGDYSGHMIRQKEVALMFYAHRCLPNLHVADPFRPEDVPLDGLIFGIAEIENHDPGFDRKVHRLLTVLHESELCDA